MGILAANGIVYGKVAGIGNQESGTVSGISVIYGYPEAASDNLAKVILLAPIVVVLLFQMYLFENTSR